VKRDIKIKGNTVDEKINNIELILQRMSRKLSTKMIAVVSPTPFFNYIDSPDADDVVARMMFPAAGKITSLCYHFEQTSKSVDILLNIKNGITGASLQTTQKVKKSSDIIYPDFTVNPGDMFTIKVTPQEDEQVLGVWIGILYEMSSKDVIKKDFLLSEFTKLTDEEVKGL